ncbi:storkhead-box protein 1 isoform X1 [Peromyscus leucopus]|uniref:storkhead-box protein 1 isoform X1 n=1 Tax=Peromyscus leucopus TaxID=10041 RepID=UPI001884FA15|nr:storkhead-box protein 1 isoform X1 [Peromyscus leucopus]
MAPPVQLAPGSLALVLSPREAGQAAGEPGGRALFRAFRRANARCFWNARLARAASRLAFLGWLQRRVLLVRAPQPCVQVLRDAWRRRALRSPRGFRITAVGDVFPVQMSPIAQCRFVPLAEVLCCVIADMNAAQVAVTQDSLLEHLKKHYPGIAVPSPDILYSTLGALIQGRKIYHTGEGYFIVTPNTYFITNTPMQENQRALLPEEGCPVPTSVTYLVSVDCCAELAQENEAPVSHCPSRQCFLDTSVQDAKAPLTGAEVSRKNQDGLEEPTPLSKNQVAAASEDAHVCVSPKPLPDTKDKGKKFGFGFLWRSLSRREKPRTEHCSFSAQFPPEEWPVRDEESSNNIPRDVEHAIIRSINPVLTVDNLIKHTVLMQKYEEQKKYNSQGTSTDALTTRRQYSSKEGIRKRQGRFAKPHRRGCSHRGRHQAWSQGSELEPGSTGLSEKHPKVPAAQSAPRMKSRSEEMQQLHGGMPAVQGPHLIYKKQISNPFQGMYLRGPPVSKGHNVQKSHDLKPGPVGPEEKPFQRAGSSRPLGVFDGGGQEPYLEQCHDKLEAETVLSMKAPGHPVRDVRGGPGNYPPGNVLPSHPRGCSFRESVLRGDVHNEKNKILRKSYSDCDMFLGTKEMHQVLPSQSPPSLDPVPCVCTSVNKTVHQFQNLGLLDCPVGANHLRTHERQGDSQDLSRKTFVPEAEIENVENEGPSDSEQDEAAVNQSEAGMDDGACSSLYLEDDDFSETDDDSCHTLPGHTQYSFAGGGRPKQWQGRPMVTGRFLTGCNSKTDRFEPLALERKHWYKATGLSANSGEGPNPDLKDNPGLYSGTPFGFHYEGEPTAACVQASAAAGGSLLEFSTARKTSCGAEILRDSPGDAGKNSTSWRQSRANQEMEKHFADKSRLFNTSHVPVLAQESQREHSRLEGTESYSVTGDSGIDSPRTQSLASNNSAIWNGVKRRQAFLRNGEDMKKSHQTPSSLLQLTPVINV